MTIILDAQPTTVYLGTCAPCRRPVRARNDQATTRYLRLTCPECHRTVTGERLHATTNADPCHGRCMGATGPACSCSCGGDNHGRLWEYQSEMTETALAAYRARIAEQEAAAARRAQAAAARRRATFQTWADQHTDVITFLGDGSQFDAISDDPSDFLSDMAHAVNRHQTLTDNQAAAVIRCRNARQRIATRRAEDAANARPVPTGEAVTITGTIIYADAKDNPYGPGVRLTMLVKGDGWKVWSTIPRAIMPNTTTVHWRDQVKGRRIQFTADVTAKPDNPTEGTAKRPRKATILTEAQVAAA
ncbi:MAG: hypothetical protein JXA67_10760 [Micromonosporaceae bacterium]|nr:hypothetical protein [Micromonosporaceae bacterium]